MIPSASSIQHLKTLMRKLKPSMSPILNTRDQHTGMIGIKWPTRENSNNEVRQSGDNVYLSQKDELALKKLKMLDDEPVEPFKGRIGKRSNNNSIDPINLLRDMNTQVHYLQTPQRKKSQNLN